MSSGQDLVFTSLSEIHFVIVLCVGSELLCLLVEKMIEPQI